MRLRTTTISILAIGLLAGSTVGLAAQDEGSSPGPAFFTWSMDDSSGDLFFGEFDDSGRYDATTGRTLTGGTIEADDPRASGRYSLGLNEHGFGDADVEAPEVIIATSYAQRLVNDGGSWSGTGRDLLRVPPGDGEPTGVSIATLTGEGGYDGLTMVLVRTDDEGSGWILPDDFVPPVPDLPSE